MKKLVPLMLLPILVMGAYTDSLLIEELALGSTAPMTDVAMQDVSGEMLSLEEVAGENGLLVVFSSNTCPWVHAWEDRYLSSDALAEELGIGMVLVNPNEAHREGDESLEAMRTRAEAMGYTMPYVVDEDHRLADAYGATRTPHVYLFDEDMTLVYRGAIDDEARNPDQVEQRYLADAMRQMVAGEAIATPTSKSVGCTIKRLQS